MDLAFQWLAEGLPYFFQSPFRSHAGEHPDAQLSHRTHDFDDERTFYGGIGIPGAWGEYSVQERIHQ